MNKFVLRKRTLQFEYGYGGSVLTHTAGENRNETVEANKIRVKSLVMLCTLAGLAGAMRAV